MRKTNDVIDFKCVRKSLVISMKEAIGAIKSRNLVKLLQKVSDQHGMAYESTWLAKNGPKYLGYNYPVG